MSTFGLQVFNSNGQLRLDLTSTLGRIVYSGFVSSSGAVNCYPYQGVNSLADKFATGLTIPYTLTNGYSGAGGDIYWSSTYQANWSFTPGSGVMFVLIIGWR